MSKWQAKSVEIITALQQLGWTVELKKEKDNTGWCCKLTKGEVMVEAFGVTRLSTMWATVIEAIKLVP